MKQIEKHLPNLVKAAFENDKEIIEASTLSIMRILKKRVQKSQVEFLKY